MLWNTTNDIYYDGAHMIEADDGNAVFAIFTIDNIGDIYAVQTPTNINVRGVFTK